MVSRLLASVACLLALVATGCRYTGRYITERTPVEVAWKAGPSTTVYVAVTTGGSAAIGKYSFSRYEGTAVVTTPGAGNWGLAERTEGKSSRAVAQPLATRGAQLKSAGDGVEIAFEDGMTCRLSFVRGTWADYLEGREIVLQLAEESWNQWTTAIHNGFLDLVDDLRRRVHSSLGWRDSLTEAESPDILVHEKPLFRADRRQLMIFFERLEVSSKFEVTHRRRDPAHVWWVSGYSFTPGAERFMIGVGAVTARVALDVGHAVLHHAAHCR